MQLDFFFQYGVVASLVTLAIITSQSAGRDLRPSDHGLAYQENTSPPTQNGNGSFFGSTTPSSPTLPEAQSTGGGGGGGGGEDRSRDVRGDLTRMGLLVASAICGVAGVVLLVVSAVVFIVRRRKHRAELAERLAPDYELHTVNDK
ncbi:hypothetical protein ACP275_08G129400 [Erythranthe tilingii]